MGPICMECLLDGFKNSLVLSESLSYCKNYVNFYYKFRKKKIIQKDIFNLQDGTYRSIQNVGNHQCSPHNIPKE